MKKTPDEIKKGLIHCTQADEDCNGCPYDPLCFRGDLRILEKHALAYIQQLEKMLGESFARNAPALEAAYGLAEKVKKLESQVPKWISVEDEQKPQHHKEVLCRYIFDGDSECFYAVLTYYAYGDNGYVTGSHFTGEGLHDMRVTHWMPLPEPPEV